MDDTLREELADISHDIWSHWMQWMFSVGTMNADGTWTMPADEVERWKWQMVLDYSNLTEREKDSNREQADKILAVIGLMVDEQPEGFRQRFAQWRRRTTRRGGNRRSDNVHYVKVITGRSGQQTAKVGKRTHRTLSMGQNVKGLSKV